MYITVYAGTEKKLHLLKMYEHYHTVVNIPLLALVNVE